MEIRTQDLLITGLKPLSHKTRSMQCLEEIKFETCSILYALWQIKPPIVSYYFLLLIVSY